MDSSYFDSELFDKRYNRCKERNRLKLERLCKTNFPEVKFKLHAQKVDVEPNRLHPKAPNDSLSSITSSDLLFIYNICDPEHIRRGVQDWELLREDEEELFQKIIELMVHLHHPLKKQENTEMGPLLQYKQKNLLASLMRTIDLQYKTFQTIKMNLEHCIDIANYKETDGEAQGTAEQLYKKNQYDEYIKKSKQVQERKTLTEQIMECELKLREYCLK